MLKRYLKKKKSYGHFALEKNQLCISGALLSCIFFVVVVSFHFGFCLLGQKQKRLNGIDKPKVKREKPSSVTRTHSMP